ncbi:aldo/keto reductase [Streptomyces sp. NPDC056237]|uniref:aldo/keto reductase n=1 Tax=unclassified Streptomyces TaxID=2593676 RepID=UPI0035DEB55F
MSASHLPRRRLVAGWDEHPLGVGCRPIGGPATNLGSATGWAFVDDDCTVDALLHARVSAARFAFLVQQFDPKVITTPFSTLSQPPPEHGAAGSEEDEGIFSFARRHNVATMITEPLSLGLLAGKYLPGMAFGPGDVRSRITTPVLDAVERGLQPLRDRFGSTPHDLARVALLYCLRRCPDSIVLAGFIGPQQVAVNYQGLKSGLSEADHEFVDAAYAALRAELEAAGRPRPKETAPLRPIPGASRPAHATEER